MTKLVFSVALAVLLGPVPVGAQIPTERVGASKQKAWLVSNFRNGLSECSVLRDGVAFSVSGAAVPTFVDRDSDDDGYDFSVSESASGSVPAIAAHAINTKGTGATNGRSAGQACALAPSPRGTIPAARGSVAGITGGAVAGIVVATCSVSGDSDAPNVRFTIPLSSFGAAAAKTYVGHVTLIRREASLPSISEFNSKQGAMKVIASCDVSGLSAKAGAPRASYDLAVSKKV